MALSRIQIAKPDIVSTFEEGPRVLHAGDLVRIFDAHRANWRLAKSMSVTAFLKYLLERTNLKEARFNFPMRPVVGYTWGDVPLFEVLLGLVDNSYLSHYTAVRIHGLTEQIPKTIYLSQAKGSGTALNRSDEPQVYDQTAIDLAFSRPPRASKNEVELHKEGVRVVLLHGAYQAAAGITAGRVNLGGERELALRFTNLERTLIDIVVRPFYAGGVFEVAKAFENAKDRLSVNSMAAMLTHMAFGYPYHQAIGFYLERAGYKKTLLDLFAKRPMERDFYLTHDMGRTSYNSRWRLHIPEGF
jgi:predicted transcriptional regulator of viral defense system